MNYFHSLFTLRLLACFAILFTLCPTADADHVKGILVPEMVSSHRNKLHLNGTAIRSKWGFNVYVVALYLTQQNKSADAIMLNRDPKRVHITMLHGVSEKRFVGTIEKCIDMNFSKEEKEKYASNLKAFMACFHGGTSLKKFSTIDIDYIPGKGMEVSVDQEKFKLIPDDNFYHAILRLWIGKPLQASLKTGLC